MYFCPVATFDTKLLKDPEVILRVKRRVGPMLWSGVSTVLESLQDVLERSAPPAPDRLAPKPEPAKRAAKGRRRPTGVK